MTLILNVTLSLILSLTTILTLIALDAPRRTRRILLTPTKKENDLASLTRDL